MSSETSVVLVKLSRGRHHYLRAHSQTLTKTRTSRVTFTEFIIYYSQSLCRSSELLTVSLTFKNCASYIEDGRTGTLQMLHFTYIVSTNISTEYFKHAAHSPFFFSKCSLCHKDIFFGSSIIHILHTGCAKI
jgi:hypothetical protein